MGGGYDDLGPGTRFEQRRDALGHGAAGRDHVVHDQTCPARHVAHDVGHLGLGAALASLVQDDDRCAEAPRELGGEAHAPDIRRDHGEAGRQPIAQRPAQRRHRRQAVHGGMEEALDLGGVQIHRDHVGDPHGLQQIGSDARRDRLAATVPLVRPRVTEVGHDRHDAGGRRTTAGIGECQQLNQVIVDRRRGRLHEEHFFAAHRLEQLHRYLAIREPVDGARADLHVQLVCDRLRQHRVSRAGENREASAHAGRSTHSGSAPGWRDTVWLAPSGPIFPPHGAVPRPSMGTRKTGLRGRFPSSAYAGVVRPSLAATSTCVP